MAYENNEKRMESVYSKRIRAGKRRTYFFDVRATRANDYYLTITESRKKFNEDGYDRHKIFLYKEDFNKFLKGLTEAIDYVKTDLMPDFDFDAYNHDQPADSEYTPSSNGMDHSPASEIRAEAELSTEPEMSPVTDSAPEPVKEKAEEPTAGGQTEEVDKW